MNHISLSKIKYRLFIPSGNMTALVEKLERDAYKRRLIQDHIMARRPGIEQVGFIGGGPRNPELIMAGGEFCGNAARSAAWLLLDGMPGEISIRVSGAKEPINTGVTAELEAWAEIPVSGGEDAVRIICDGIYLVKLEGISHLILSYGISAQFLRELRGGVFPDNLLAKTQNALSDDFQTYMPLSDAFLEMKSSNAFGIIYTECVGGVLKVHPCVFVKSSGTAFYETACGSGSAAVAIAECARLGRDVAIPLLQPSGMYIGATVRASGGRVAQATISGPIKEVSADQA